MDVAPNCHGHPCLWPAMSVSIHMFFALLVFVSAYFLGHCPLSFLKYFADTGDTDINTAPSNLKPIYVTYPNSKFKPNLFYRPSMHTLWANLKHDFAINIYISLLFSTRNMYISHFVLYIWIDIFNIFTLIDWFINSNIYIEHNHPWYQPNCSFSKKTWLLYLLHFTLIKRVLCRHWSQNQTLPHLMILLNQIPYVDDANMKEDIYHTTFLQAFLTVNRYKMDTAPNNL